MLAKLMDTAALKRACGLETAEYANAATLGLLPRACGQFNGVPVWFETDVRKFANEVGKTFDESWSDIHITLASQITKSAPEAQQVAHAEADRQWPEEMHQELAAQYMGCGSQVLQKGVKAGVLNFQRDGRLIVFRKEDLDAYRELPIFSRRITRKKHKKGDAVVVAKPAEPHNKAAMANAQTLLTEKGAADFLGIHYGALALSRKYGTGPVVAIDSAGVPRYRLCDLQEFAERHLKSHDHTDTRSRTEVVKSVRLDGTTVAVSKAVAKSTGEVVPAQVKPVEPQTDTAPIFPKLAKLAADKLLSMDEVAQYLGVKGKSIGNWRMRDAFADADAMVPGRGSEAPRWRAATVLQWAVKNAHRIERSKAQIAHGHNGPDGKVKNAHIGNGVKNGTRRPGAKKVLKATSARRQPTRVANSRATLGGARVRH